MKKIFTTALILSAIFSSQAFAQEKRHNPRGDEMHHDRMLKKIDSNNDEEISKYEWQRHHEKKFSEMDKDGNGVISQDEAKQHHEEMRKKLGDKKDVKRKEIRRDSTKTEEISN